MDKQFELSHSGCALEMVLWAFPVLNDESYGKRLRVHIHISGTCRTEVRILSRVLDTKLLM
jgi:hypothetical protein